MSPLSRLQRLRARRTGRAALASVALAAVASTVGLLGGFSSFAAGEPASVIVRFDAGTTTEQRDAAVAAVGGTVVDAIPALRMEVVEVPADDVYGAIATLRADDVVTSADLDRPREAQAAPNDPAYDVQWALDRIGWDEIYGTIDLQGTSRLAVLDTGVDANDPDLADRIVSGWSAFPDETAWFDPNGHGTALASIAASVTDNGEGIAGVAYGGVEIMPIRVLDGTGIGQDADIIEGLVWAVDHGADVALMGFSSTGYSSALQAAVEYAWSNGVVVVAAVGNDGNDLSHFPAAMAKVVGVSATNQSDARWSGSNFGTSVFMAAPGTGIESILGPVTGTSPAAAIVAGAAALLQAVDPGADPGVIVGRLARNADPVASTDDVGNGILNLAAAVADGGTERVVPVGGAPVGDGGPYVTYQAATYGGTASVDLRTWYVGDSTGAAYTFSFTNTGTGADPAIQSIRVTRPSNAWTITGCSLTADAPTGSTATKTTVGSADVCHFRMGDAGAGGNIGVGASATGFVVTATTAAASANVTSSNTWTVRLDNNDDVPDNDGNVDASAASTGSLSTSLYVWQVTDIALASSAPTIGASCPTGKSAPAGQTRVVVICGKNWGQGALTLASANSTLSGASLIQTLGTFTNGSVASAGSGVIAYYPGTTMATTAGSASASATVGSSATATSPSRTVTGFTITAVPSVTLSRSSSSMAETGGSLTLTATLSETYAEDVTVNLTYSQAPQTDFSGAASITVTAGQTTGSITVTATSDISMEGDESFTVDISSVVNGLESGTQQVSFTIVDDDFGTVAIDLTCQSGAACRTLTEGSAADVETNKLASNISNASATSISVSQVVSPGVVGNTVETKALIRIDSELMNVTANTCLPTVSVGTCTYTVERGANGSTAASHNANAKVIFVQRLPLKLTNATGDVTGTIDWETAADPSPAVGTAPATGGDSCSTSGVDYVTQATTTVSLAAATSSNITVRICQDTVYEKTETFAIKLSNATGPAGATVSPSTATYYVVTIQNDEVAPTLAINNVTQNEGNSATSSFGFTVTRSFPSGTTATEVAATVDYATADGATPASAATTADGDYVATSGTLTFAAGDTTQPISVTVNGDSQREVTETFRVLLSNPAYATITTSTGTGTITNDDDGITFSIGLGASGATSKAEAATTFPMRITSVGTVPGSVSYATAGSGTYQATGGASCTAGVDYVLSSATVSMGSASASEVTATSDFAITVCADAIYENSETFTVTLSSPTVADGYTGTAALGSPSTYELAITNDDAAPAITFSPVTAITTNEGNDGSSPGTAVTVTLARSQAAQVATTVTYTLTGTGTNAAVADDFAGNAFPTGTATFASGGTSTTFTFNLNGDTTVEPGNTFTMTLSNVSPASTATLPSALAGNLIVNDDTVLRIAQENAGFAPEVDEPATGSTLFPMRVSFVSGSAPSTGLALTYTPSGSGLNDAGASCGAATEDYRLTATSATVASGSSAFQSFNVEVCANTEAEADEILRIALTVAGGHAIVESPGYAEVTIHDIDKAITGKVVADRDANGSYGGTDALIKSRPVYAYLDDGDGVFEPDDGDGVYEPPTEDQPLVGSPFSSGSSGGSTGIFTISGLSAGDYWLTHTVQTGFEAVYAAPGANAVKLDQAGYEKNLLKVTLGGSVATATENNFFETRRGSSISGEVVEDLDGDGTVDTGEPGLAAATVALYRDDPLASVPGSVVGTRDAHDEVIGTLTGDTLVGGIFTFGGDDPETVADEDLLPGTYFLVETNPDGYGDTGYVLGSVSGGATGSAVTRVSDNEFKIVLVNASTTQPTSSGNDFLDAAQSGTIAGAVRNDTSGDGVVASADSLTLLGGATITVYRDNTRAGTAGSLDAADTQTWSPTATDGTFSQAALTPGVYFVTASRTEHLATNVRPDPDGVGTASKVAVDQIKITIPAGGGTNGDNAFLFSLARSTVSGFVYDDLNANTLDDESPKVGVSGAVIRIYRETSGTATGAFDFTDRNGNGMFDVANETTTEELISTSSATLASGAFSFSGLRNGTYYLLRSNPNTTWTSMNAFPEAARVTVNRVTVSVTGTVGSVSTDTVYLASLATAQIGVAVFEDLLGDSVGDTIPTSGLTEDTALTGATLALYRDDPLGAAPGSVVGSYDASDPLVTTQDLATASSHTFTGLLVGTYFVVETDPTGFQSVTAVPGSGANTVSSNETVGDPAALVKNRLKVVISLAAAISTNNRFVDESIYAISGFVLNDSNADGAANDGGLRLAGASLTLYVDNTEPGQGTVGTYDAGVDAAWGGATDDAATKVTDGTGSFGFGLAGLPTGTYFVVLGTPPTNYGFTEALPSGVTETPSFGASKEAVSVIQVDLGPTRNSTGNRFLLTRNDYVISGMAVNDDEVDLTDTGDPPLAELTVTLYRGASLASAIAVGSPQVTPDGSGVPAAGSFSFGGLTAGTYFLVGTPPTGYAATSTLSGSGTTSSESVDRTTIKVVITAPGLVGDAAKVSANNRFLAALAGSTISGAVKEDVDASLTDSASDTPLGNAAVTLWLDFSGGTGVGTFDAAVDKLWETTTTVGDGLFSFDGLPAGTYFLVETDPAGYGSFTALPSARRETVNRLKVTGIDGTSGTDSADNLFLDAIANASLAGIVYDDADGNGAITFAVDPVTGLDTQSEFGKDGVTVTISVDVNADTVVDLTTTQVTSTMTSIAGSFEFTGLVQGSYTVSYTVPTGWRNTGVTPNANPQTVTVTRSTPSTGTLFFTQQANATILGQVFNDTSGDGVWQKSGGSAESVAGQNIRIYIDGYDGAAANGVWDSATEPSALTSSTGTFTISGVAKGTYKVQIVLPTGKATINAPVSATVTAGGSATGKNIGIQAASTLTGYVLHDVNHSGTVQNGWDTAIAGVTVYAYRDLSSTGALTGDGLLTAADITGSTARVWSATTDSDGSFSITPVPTGTYFLIEGAPVLSGSQYDGTTNYPSGYRSMAAIVCTASCATNTSAYSAATSNRMKVTIAAAASAAGTTTTAGYFLDAATDSVTISGTVYNDANADGSVAVGSGTLAGATIKVFKDLDADGAVDDDGDNAQEAGEDLQMWPAIGSSSTTTPAGGTYAWSDLPTGTYLVGETNPTNYSSTNAIPDSGVTGRTATKKTDDLIEIAVTAASTTSSSNFFLDTQDNDVTISGFVYDDLNADGTKNGDDAGLAGAEVRIYKDSGNGTFALAEETLMYATHADGVRREYRTTPADGTYSFGDLPTGTYWVVQTTPAGYSAIMTQSGSGTNTTVTLQTAARSRILVAATAASATRTGLEFLDTRDDSVTISGTVYNDVNADGAVAVGSSGLAGSTMKVFKDTDGDGAVDDDGDNTQEAGEDLQVWQAINASPWRSATVTAGAGGTYSFSGLPTGTYLVVQATDPSGYSSTNAIADTGTTGRTATKRTNDVIEVAVTAASTTSPDNLFLDTPDNDVSVSGFVYDDLDADGNKDTVLGVDQGLANVQVRVYRDANANGSFDYTDTNANGRFDVASETTTDTLIWATHADGTGTRREYRTTPADGSFSFGDLPTGTHFIVQTLPSGYSAIKTKPDPATTSGNITATPLASDKTVIKVATSGASGPWSRSDLQFLDTRDDGVTIRGFVYSDTDGDGVYGGSDLGLAGATVRLYKDADNDGLFSAINDRLMYPTVNGGARASSKTTTAAAGAYGAGEYAFGGLPKGTYFVVETDPSGGYTSTGVQVTSAKASAETGAPKDRIKVIPDTDGETISGNRFLDAIPNGSISGVMVDDLNGNGVRDAKKGGNNRGDDPLNGGVISIFKDDGDNVLETDGDTTDEAGEDTYVGFTTTSGSAAGLALGEWSYTGLLPGTYFVRQDPPIVTTADGDVDYRPSGATFKTTGSDSCDKGTPKICANVDADRSITATPYRVKGEWLRVRLSPIGGDERMTWASLDFLAQGADFEIAITNDSDYDGDLDVDTVTSRYAGTPSVAVGEPGIYTVKVTNAGVGIAPAGALVTVRFPLGSKVGRISGGDVLDVSSCATGTTTRNGTTVGSWSCKTRYTLAGAASVDILLAIQVPPSYPTGNFLVDAEIYSAGDSNLVGDTIDGVLRGFNGPVEDTDAITAAADITIAKTESRAAVAGTTGDDSLEYTLVVTNAGPSTAASTTITEVLPDPATFTNARYCIVVPGTQDCTADAAFTAWTGATTISLGEVASESGTWAWPIPGAYTSSTTTTVKVRIDVDSDVNGAQDTAFRLTNTASVTTTAAYLSVAGDRTDSVESPVSTLSDLSVTKSTATAVEEDGVTYVVAGEQIDYHIDVVNDGPSDAQSVELAELLPMLDGAAVLTGVEWCSYVTSAPPCTTFSALSGSAPTIDLPSAITKGATVRVILRGTIPSSLDLDEKLTNEVTVSSATADPDAPDTTELTAEVTDTVAVIADLGADWELPSGADPMIDETLTYDLIISNLGPSDSRDITVVAGLDGLVAPELVDEILPEGMTCDPVDAVEKTITCAIDYLAADAERTITLTGDAGYGDSGSYPDTTGSAADIWEFSNEVTVESTYSVEPDEEEAENLDVVAFDVDKRPVVVDLTLQTLVPMYGKTIVIDAVLKDEETDLPLQGRSLDFIIDCDGSVQTYALADPTDVTGATQAEFLVDVEPDDACTVSVEHASATSRWADGEDSTTTPIRVDKFEIMVGYTGSLFVEVAANATPTSTTLVPQAWVGYVPESDLTDATASALVGTTELTDPELPELQFIVHKVDLATGALTWVAECTASDPIDPSSTWDWTYRCTPSFTPLVNTTYEITMRVPDSDPFFQAEDQKVYVTVFQPSQDMYATGGGFIIGAPSDPGLIDVSDVYDHLNFSFHVKYKKGSNTKTSSPTGAFFLRFLGTGEQWEYRARTTAWNKGALVFTGVNSKASFQSMMTLTRIDTATGLADPTYGGGNYTLRVDVTGDVLTKTRTIAFTIYTPRGSIIFYQAGTIILQRPLGGGSVVVKSK